MSVSDERTWVTARGLLRVGALPSFGLALCVLGCEPPESSAPSATVRDSAGIEIVENGEASWDATTTWRLSTEPVVRIGELSSSDPALQFSLIRGMSRLSDGRIVVLESQGNELRYFDAQGRHLFTRGGQGQGPGEFRSAHSLTRLPGDTILVADAIAEYEIFGPSGDFLRREPMGLGEMAGMASWQECVRATLPDRSMIRCVSEPGQPAIEPSPGPGHLRESGRYVRVTPAHDSVVPLGLYGGLEQWGVAYEGRTTFVIHPWHSASVLAWGGDPVRIAIAINPEYSIEVWAPGGELERIVRRPGGRPVPTAAERGEALDRMATFRSGYEELANRVRAEVEPPDAPPAVRQMFLDPANHLWVLQPTASLAPGQGSYDVFDPAGRYLGAVTMPAGFYARDVGQDYVLGLLRDELDVPRVRLYALDRRRGR